MAQIRYSSSGRQQVFDVADTFSIGADDTNDLPLPSERAVSPRHARLRREADGYVVEDLGSGGGTVVERSGDQLAVTSPLRLMTNDVIRIGSARLIFDAGRAAAASDADRTRVPEATRVGRKIPIVPAPSEAAPAEPGSSSRLPLLLTASLVVAILAVALAVLLANLAR